MTAKLIAVSGPLKQTTFELGGGNFSIGRDSGNSVCLDSRAVSRRHCVIRHKQGSYEVEDLGSHNGTLVNGVAVSRRILSHGDKITISDFTFAFSSEELDSRFLAEVLEFEGKEQLAYSTVQVAETLSSTPQHLLGHALSTKAASELKAILSINRLASSSRDPESLQHSLLDLAFELTSAERAAVLLFEQSDEAPTLVLGRERLAAPTRNITVSRTVVRRVQVEKVAVLARNLELDEDLKDAPSIVGSGCRSILCVPLLSRERCLGTLYLDSRQDAAFDDHDLETLAAVAGVVGMALESALDFQRLRRQAQLLRAELDQEGDIVGETAAIKRVYSSLLKVATSDSTVMLLGESGTGKELAARAIHRNSPRAEKPFVAINCATLSDNLLENELFGHEKGAFTGAFAVKKGQLEIADGGTVFLDEVAELPATVQAKLLRVLQERNFPRVGGTRAIHVNIRLIAATNKDLHKAIAAGTFRQDLWHRLNVISIKLPPLRERREDIALLATYFVAKLSKKCRRPVRGLSPEAQALLMGYDWPGNVRELENAIERAIVLGSDEEIKPHDLPETIWETAPSSPQEGIYHSRLIEVKKKLVREALEASHGNVTEAARRLGVHTTYLHRLLHNLGLRSAA
jgi:Nif-specific regulatory protein